MCERPDVVCTSCGWQGSHEALLPKAECDDDTGPWICPECADPGGLMTYDEYLLIFNHTETEGCPDL